MKFNAPRTNILALAAVGLVLAAFLQTGEVRAQAVTSPKIAIVDVQRAMRDAQASKGILPQFEKLREAFQKQVREQEQALRKAEQELAQQRAILSSEAFAQKRRAFSEQAREIQQAVQQRRRNLDQAFNETRNLILKNMIDVTQEIAKERDLNMVMDRKFVFISATSLDITDEVIERLNKRLPEVSLEFEKGRERGPANSRN